MDNSNPLQSNKYYSTISEIPSFAGSTVTYLYTYVNYSTTTEPSVESITYTSFSGTTEFSTDSN